MRDQQFKVICVLDEALDTSALTVDEVVEYIRDRDFKIVDGKWVPGEKPTIFHVSEVPHGLWESYIMAGTSNDYERWYKAFIAGVRKVESLVGEDGVAVTSWEPAVKRGKHTMMTDEEAARFPPSQREEIGRVIYQHSFLPRKMRLCLPLPSFVVEHLERRRFRLAELSQTTASATNNAEPSVSTAQTPSATGTTTEQAAAV
jgi:hypothetical protein